MRRGKEPGPLSMRAAERIAHRGSFCSRVWKESPVYVPHLPITMLMNMSPSSYIPALRYRRLTRFYDPVVRLTTRESAFKQALVRQAGIEGQHRILDLGCGTGTLAAMVKRAYPTTNVVGLDADTDALNLARTKAAKDGVEVRFDEGFASALPYANDSFDRVLSSLFFHHFSLESKKAGLREVLRVLRPGGEVHIADWGKPTSLVMRLAFLGVQFLDGFATTADSVTGVLPDLLRQFGFDAVETTQCFATLFGTLALDYARKPTT